MSEPSAVQVATGRIPSAGAILVFGLVCAGLATALPLATYTVSLAAFGLVHVLSELRYVDERFGQKVGERLRWQIGGLLCAVLLGRVLQIAGHVSVNTGRPLELGLVAVMAASAWPQLRRARPWAAVLALVVAGGLAAGALWAPASTLLFMAVAHNLTPIGFLAERLGGVERAKMLRLIGVLLALAGFIASGWPVAWLDQMSAWRPEFSLLKSAGSLNDHLLQYVPAAWHRLPIAVSLFSAAVFLQCLHYGAVIKLLPALGAGRQESASLLHWPRRVVFLGAVGVAGLLLFGGFVVSFTDARVVYSLAAVVHAWIEIPILLLALAPPSSRAEG